jgi:hypothetical protein
LDVFDTPQKYVRKLEFEFGLFGIFANVQRPLEIKDTL